MDKENIIADSIANNLLNKDSRDFWASIGKVMQGKSISSPITINGCNGDKNICDMWYSHFKDLLNSSQDRSIKHKILDQVQEKCNSFDISECYFSQQDVRKAVQSLKRSKSAGLDCIYAEHFIHASERVVVL
mgnify:CR=1 FL=1